MNFFKKLFHCNRDSASGNDILFSPEDSRFQSLISLPAPIIHPGDMMEELGIAMCLRRQTAVSFGSKDIKAYEVRLPGNNKHLCFFLGLLENNSYYGNIPGTTCICTCKQSDYVFKESKSFLMPMQIHKDRVYMLECSYDCNAFRVEADCLYKVYRKDGRREAVIRFEGDDRRLNRALPIIKDSLC